MKRRPFAPMRAVSLIEPLEERIAPAALAISPNGKEATYSDTQGDTIIVTTTAGKFLTGMFTFASGNSGQLTELNLSGHSAFNGTNLAFSILPIAGGVDSVNVGFIDASGLSLGSVTVPGDLGQITVGGGTSTTALGRLTLTTLGAMNTAQTQSGLGSAASLESSISGAIGRVSISGDLDGFLNVMDFKTKLRTGSIGSLTVGGSLDANSGSGGVAEVTFTGRLGSAVIGGGLEGGSTQLSGSIAGNYGELASIGSVIVKGSVPDDPNPNPIPGLPGTSIYGGSGDLSGNITATSVGSVVVAGDVFGGTGTASGSIQAGVKLGKVVIDGSLLGGNFTTGNPDQAASAGVVFGASIGSVTIGKNLYGGSGIQSGAVLSQGSIQKVTVLGNVGGGTAGNSSADGLSGTIRGNKLGTIIIQGSLTGGNLVSNDPNQLGSDDGGISSATTIGGIYIGQTLTGGSGPSAGDILTKAGGIGTLTIGVADLTTGMNADSSLAGGAGSKSGLIMVAGPVGKMTLTHGVTGGAGENSGEIEVNGTLSSLTIGGNVVGSTGSSSGLISIFGSLKSGLIKGNVQGGNNTTATTLVNSGYIQADTYGTLTVTGDLISGEMDGTGTLDTCGAIRATTSIGTLTLGGIVGNAKNPAIISAPGLTDLPASAKTDVAINTLTVTGNVSYGDILAGYSTNTQTSTVLLGTGVNANAQIGTVTIEGNYTATNIIAGVGAGTGGFFGNSASLAMTGAGVTDLPSIYSKISKIVITGQVIPTVSTADSYGIAAQYIVSANVTQDQLGLRPGADNDTFAFSDEKTLPVSSGTPDVFLYEV
jgi:hypothetical protein